MDYASLELLGQRVSTGGISRLQMAAVEEALIELFGHSGQYLHPLVLRIDAQLAKRRDMPS
jgi:hypothetical protein